YAAPRASPSTGRVTGSVVEDERHLEHVLVRGDPAVGDLDGLVLDPRARHVAQSLARALDAEAHGVVEACGRAGRDGRDAGDRAHGVLLVHGPWRAGDLSDLSTLTLRGTGRNTGSRGVGR